MNAYESILEDLRTLVPGEISNCPPPYDDQSSISERFNTLQDAIVRSRRLGHRTLQLVNLYYMGKLLEKELDGVQRSQYVKQLSDHYRVISVRMYYMFEPFGVQQIARTTRITPTMIRELKQHEYQELVVQAIVIFNGVENQEGG